MIISLCFYSASINRLLPLCDSVSPFEDWSDLMGIVKLCSLIVRQGLDSSKKLQSIVFSHLQRISACLVIKVFSTVSEWSVDIPFYRWGS